MFEDENEKVILISKAPQYFYNEDVPARVLETNPNMSLLLIVRDPFVRTVSAFAQFVDVQTRNGHNLSKSLEKATLKYSTELVPNIAELQNSHQSMNT